MWILLRILLSECLLSCASDAAKVADRRLIRNNGQKQTGSVHPTLPAKQLFLFIFTFIGSRSDALHLPFLLWLQAPPTHTAVKRFSAMKIDSKPSSPLPPRRASPLFSKDPPLAFLAKRLWGFHVWETAFLDQLRPEGRNRRGDRGPEVLEPLRGLGIRPLVSVIRGFGNPFPEAP